MSSPVLKTLKNASSSSEESVAKPLWKDERERKRKAEGGPCSVASGPCRQSQEASVRFLKRPDERWRTWVCQGTPHLSWDKQGSVSPSAITLYWPRMLKGWQIVSGRRWREGDGRGLWLFIKESDNKIKRLQECRRERVALTDHLWQCSSIMVRLQKLHTLLSDRDNQDLTHFKEGKTTTGDRNSWQTTRGCSSFRVCQWERSSSKFFAAFNLH